MITTMTGTATMTAAASGSEGAGLGLGLNPKAAGFRRLFNGLRRLSKAGKNPLGLLDIRRSLC